MRLQDFREAAEPLFDPLAAWLELQQTNVERQEDPDGCCPDSAEPAGEAMDIPEDPAPPGVLCFGGHGIEAAVVAN